MNSGGGKKQYDHLIKLIIIGDSSVGKSCILLRFSEDHFPTSHMPTIGKSKLHHRKNGRETGCKGDTDSSCGEKLRQSDK